MVSRKKSTVLGVAIVVVLVASVSYVYLFSGTPHETFLSKKQAEEISGQQYNMTTYTTAEGTYLLYGAAKVVSVEYSQGYTLTGEFFDRLTDSIYLFNNTAQAQITYFNLSQTFQFGSTLNLSKVGNSTYKGFAYSYFLNAEPGIGLGVLPSKMYYWAACGVSGDYVFLIVGYSAHTPQENMSTTAMWQINEMTSSPHL